MSRFIKYESTNFVFFGRSGGGALSLNSNRGGWSPPLSPLYLRLCQATTFLNSCKCNWSDYTGTSNQVTFIGFIYLLHFFEHATPDISDFNLQSFWLWSFLQNVLLCSLVCFFSENHFKTFFYVHSELPSQPSIFVITVFVFQKSKQKSVLLEDLLLSICYNLSLDLRSSSLWSMSATNFLRWGLGTKTIG